MIEIISVEATGGADGRALAWLRNLPGGQPFSAITATVRQMARQTHRSTADAEKLGQAVLEMDRINDENESEGGKADGGSNENQLGGCDPQ